jgi:hypothetical protein
MAIISGAQQRCVADAETGPVSATPLNLRLKLWYDLY